MSDSAGGAYNASSDPLAGLKGDYFNGRGAGGGGREKGGKGWRKEGELRVAGSPRSKRRQSGGCQPG